MKKKWMIGAVIVLLAIAVVVVVLITKKNDTSPAGSATVSITEDCWKQVTDLNVAEQDNGTVEVTLTAPDYVSLVELLAAENSDVVTGELIAKLVENNPEAVKEYTFIAPSAAEADVKSALMEQISYELLALTLKEMDG